jgi:hypothetical protein
MHPLCKCFGSVAVIASDLLRSSEAGSYSAAGCPVLQRKPEPCPHIHARLGETIGEHIVVVETLPQSAAACRSPASSWADRER